MHAEVERVREKKELCATLDSATRFEIGWPGERTFQDIEEFQALFIDGSTVLDFHQCLSGVDEAFAKEPLTKGQLLTL